jgi:hypothetical protein
MASEVVFDGDEVVAMLRQIEAEAPLHVRPESISADLKGYLRLRRQDLTTWQRERFERAAELIGQATNDIRLRDHASQGQIGVE